MEVIFYSTNCPKCKVLKAKMNQKGIEYKEVNDVDFMLSKGIKSAPSIEIDGRIMDFSESVKWVGSK
jgi:glutaredoxin